MRTSGAFFFLAGLLATVSCSTNDRVNGTGVGQGDTVATAREAISGGCQTGTYDSPCDPDGAGPATECQGLCRPDPAGSSGQMECFSVASLGQTADGRLCGDGTKCSNVCVAGACVQQTATDGTACRPNGNGNSNACDGQCVSGQCEAFKPAERCPYGRNGQGQCMFATCDPAHASVC